MIDVISTVAFHTPQVIIDHNYSEFSKSKTEAGSRFVDNNSESNILPSRKMENESSKIFSVAEVVGDYVDGSHDPSILKV